MRARLLVLISLTVCITAGIVTWIAVSRMRKAYEVLDDQRTTAVIAQFRSEFSRRGEQVVRQINGISKAESIVQLSMDSSRPDADLAAYVDEAAGLATVNNLDFLQLIDSSGTIISSAQWPARFGYKADWVLQAVDWNTAGYFLKSEEIPEGVALALVAVRAIDVGDKKLYITGGTRLGSNFLSSLVPQAGTRVLLYPSFSPRFSPQSLIAEAGAFSEPEKLKTLVELVIDTVKEESQMISGHEGPETFHAIPLQGREKNLLGMFLIGSSRRELLALLNRIRLTGIIAAVIGVLLGVILSYWVSNRVSRPVGELVRGARNVSQGKWDARVSVRSKDEIGELADAFNAMTQQLIDQRDRLLQAERVAAWRELARRLAHELKNPLFPLQITIENLQRAKEQAPEQFEEVFRESTGMLLAQLANLKAIVTRFGDFARMPQPQIERVDLNELIRSTVQLFEPQFHVSGHPAIHTKLQLSPELKPIQADPEQLRRVLQNLFLNAVDAMPQGGALTIATSAQNGSISLDISDTGEGLTEEECSRLFTPYYTTKQHGTGLGLAIVQSVISDHGAKISVESEPGRGTNFHIMFSAG